MPDIYLGLTESGATLLPRIRWTGGGNPTFPIDYSKQAEKSVMLSGSQRLHYKSKHPRRWRLSWEMLTVAELADFNALHGYDTELYFQNGWEDGVWRRVIIAAFEPAPFIKAGSTGCRYGLDITLEEVR